MGKNKRVSYKAMKDNRTLDEFSVKLEKQEEKEKENEHH